MFWSDPTLYGATLPYKEHNIPMQPPFMGQVLPQWQNVPRFVPPPVFNYNLNPFFGFPQALPPTPYMQTPHMQTPYLQPPYMQPPYMQTPHMQTPHMPWIDPLRRFDTPYLRPFEMQAFNPYTFYNVLRPFVY